MLFVALIGVLAQAPQHPQPSLSHGRAIVRALMQGDARRVWKHGDAQRLGSLETVTRFAANLRGFGAESRVISEGLANAEGVTVYRRTMAVTNYARGLKVEVSMDDAGRVVKLGLELARDAAPTTAGAYRTLAQLRLPLEGSWYVLWGGRTYADNKHASVSDMRYALDLLMPRNGSARSAPRSNEDYSAWRQPVLAPGSGTVVVAEDGVADNAPNRAVGGNLYGNYVVIDHGTGEYSLLAHLQKGSVRVKVGEPVSSGQPIARVGSSGMSTEPHLHYHLMDNADWRKAQGLPAQFTLFTRNGQTVERGEPRRGDTIAPVSVEARR